MIEASHEVVIDRAAAEVYAFLTDGLNDPKWRTGVLEVSRADDWLGVGALYVQSVRSPGGRSIRSDYIVTAYEPPRLFGFEVVAGPVRPHGRFELAEDGPSRTTVRSVLAIDESAGMRLMARIIGKEFTKEVQQIERLKTVLES